MTEKKNSALKGFISEQKFAMECLTRGWDVAKPYADLLRYDFVIRRPGGPWQTVQVKTGYIATYKGGKSYGIEANIRRGCSWISSPYQPGDFDLLAVVYDTQIWLIPWDAFGHLTSRLSMRGYDQFRFDGGQHYDTEDVATLIENLMTAKATNPRRKITMECAREIRQLYAEGTTSYPELAKRFDLARSSIARIVRNECYVEGVSYLRQKKEDDKPRPVRRRAAQGDV